MILPDKLLALLLDAGDETTLDAADALDGVGTPPSLSSECEVRNERARRLVAVGECGAVGLEVRTDCVCRPPTLEDDDDDDDEEDDDDAGACAGDNQLESHDNAVDSVGCSMGAPGGGAKRPSVVVSNKPEALSACGDKTEGGRECCCCCCCCGSRVCSARGEPGEVGRPLAPTVCASGTASESAPAPPTADGNGASLELGGDEHGNTEAKKSSW